MTAREASGQQLSINGYKVNFVATGQEIPVMLVHGAGESHKFWNSTLNDPPGFCKLIALDLPGHGASESQPSEVNIDFYADVVGGLVQNLQLKKPVLVGHSMGGAIVQTLAVRNPDSWRGIVLAHTGAKLGVLPEILNRIERETRLTIRENILPLGLPSDHSSQLAQRIEELMMENPPEIIADDFAACNRFDLRHMIRRIRAPTLIITGVHDRLTPLKWATFLKSNISGSRLMVIGGSGHYSMIERPIEFTSALSSFFTFLRRGT